MDGWRPLIRPMVQIALYTLFLSLFPVDAFRYLDALWNFQYPGTWCYGEAAGNPAALTSYIPDWWVLTTYGTVLKTSTCCKKPQVILMSI